MPPAKPTAAVGEPPAPADARLEAAQQHEAREQHQEYPEAEPERLRIELRQQQGAERRADQPGRHHRPDAAAVNRVPDRRQVLRLGDHGADRDEGRGGRGVDDVEPEAERHQTGPEPGQAGDEAAGERARCDQQQAISNMGAGVPLCLARRYHGCAWHDAITGVPGTTLSRVCLERGYHAQGQPRRARDREYQDDGFFDDAAGDDPGRHPGSAGAHRRFRLALPRRGSAIPSCTRRRSRGGAARPPGRHGPVLAPWRGLGDGRPDHGRRRAARAGSGPAHHAGPPARPPRPPHRTVFHARPARGSTRRWASRRRESSPSTMAW